MAAISAVTGRLVLLQNKFTISDAVFSPSTISLSFCSTLPLNSKLQRWDLSSQVRVYIKLATDMNLCDERAVVPVLGGQISSM